MLKAAKKNRVLRIPNEKADEYKKLGYIITDMKGNVLYKPEDLSEKAKGLAVEKAELQEKLQEATEYAEKRDNEVAELKEKISELETENAALKTKISELETVKPTAKKSTKTAASK